MRLKPFGPRPKGKQLRQACPDFFLKKIKLEKGNCYSTKCIINLKGYSMNINLSLKDIKLWNEWEYHHHIAEKLWKQNEKAFVLLSLIREMEKQNYVASRSPPSLPNQIEMDLE